ncbi:TPA: hypothetical protein HA371_05005 [Candidatus Woesearchaeota archaeon]|nr:hypothetical protein [Candidatus Woesearchaeota archaeon]
MEDKKDEFPIIVVYTIEDWRKWLMKNHLNEKKVGLISYKKHTGKLSVSHREAMHEAIAFGWIDTTIKRLDEERYVRCFVRRGDNANWSKNTLRYGKELLKAGRMSEHGILRYKQGLKKRPHDYGIPDNPVMPLELKEELEKNKIAKKNFDLFPPSSKKMLYRSILRAKTTETKVKRIGEIVNSALSTK